MKKVYPSAIGFSPLGLNRADFFKGCWRWIVSTQGVKNDIDPAYGKLGEAWEAACETSITSLNPGQELQREVSFRYEIAEGVQLSGRADFVAENGVIECKAHYSKSRFVNAPGEDHIAQLLLYMLQFEKTNGMLMVAYYEAEEDGSLVQADFQVFRVSIADDASTVLVDDKPYTFTVGDLIHSITSLASHLASDGFPGSPIGTACFSCPAKNVCGGISENRLTEDQVKARIREIAEKLPVTAAKIKVRKQKRGKVKS